MKKQSLFISFVLFYLMLKFSQGLYADIESKKIDYQFSHYYEVPSRDKQHATLIYLHWLGGTGPQWAKYLRHLRMPNLKMIFPTAPIVPVTASNGASIPTWFDVKALPIDLKYDQDYDGMHRASVAIHKLILNEIKQNISADQIILGGFSQGGALALYTFLTTQQSIGGILVHSTWLPFVNNNTISDLFIDKETKILQCHGRQDTIVPFQLGLKTKHFLENKFTNYQFKTYSQLGHRLNNKVLEDSKFFISSLINKRKTNN